MTESGIETALSESVMTITINRPEKRNALSPAAYRGLEAALMRAARTDVRAVILTGAGDRAFCAGHDLSAMDSDDPAEDLRFVDGIIRGLRGLEKPVISAINGAAVGGGMSLALAADVRLMSDKAKLVGGFLDLGLVPDLGASFLLVQAMGYHKALGWILSGPPMDADAALAHGLVCEVIPQADLMAEAARRASALAARPTRAIGLTKHLLQRALTSTLEEALEREARCQAIAGQSQDYAEGLAAFRERRAPVFKGQ